MARRVSSDRVLFGAGVVLVLSGVLMVYSASAVIASGLSGGSYYFLIRQVAFAAVGLGLMVMMMNVDYRRLARPLVVFPALSLQVVLLILVFFGSSSHHAHRWLHFPGGLGFEPSELSKVALVIFLAWFLDLRKDSVDDLKHTLLPVALVAGLSIALVLAEPDLGTSLTIALILAAMLFAAGLHWGYFAGGVMAAVPVVGSLIYLEPYRLRRWLAFLNPDADPLGKGFQIIQARIAVGSGGIDGVGYMAGKQKLFYLPEPHTDFIFAVIGEELGFLGCVALLALFAVLLWRGLRAAARCPDEFGRLLAIGITVLLVGQALVNLTMVVGLMPTKGIALPLVSYGGSSLLMNLLAVGILLNISRHAS
ncbi:MAG TPA: putative lipid II flippase FtsW [Terriglobia bacterium]|nr:putative lipid II flippase FtsW [Terriglobia bacterium]